jgi:aspartyl-tRNA(Asn)/glutamyl-tRNA(Gln) amidotransferase subunit C
MSVDRDTVRHIARLARIRVDESELEPLARELSAILQWVEQLSEVDTSDVPPMTSVEDDMPMKKRADEVTEGFCPEDILANAPKREGNFFVVPKVVE